MELFSDPDICSTCHVRLLSRDTVPVDLENVKPGCALCRVLMPVVSEGFHKHNRSPQSARFVTEPLQDGRSHPLPGLGPYGGNDLLLRLWFETKRSKLSHSSFIWITQLPIPDSQLPPNPTSIDFDHFRRLIDECINSAHPQCTTNHSSGEILVVRLIDCEQRKLVSASNEPYVTLSYVWGAQSASNIPTTSTSAFPQTIEDSIAVTLAMGYKYLWVDRYCIDQDNKLEVLQQISVMDRIYQQSDLTIISACGEDPHYGLPGVGSHRPRIPYHQSRSSKVQIQELLTRENFITHSYWSTRGWTYQEGIYARRRLVLTDHEAYYECSERWKWETDPSPTQWSRITPHPMFPRIGKYHQRHAVFLLQEYSRLHLTQESDILNAAAGLLRALEQGCPGFRHCWGVPVLEDFFMNEKYGKQIAPRAERWVIPLVFLLGLSWRHIRHRRGTITRRPGFPSWSWTGWRAPVEHFPWLDYRGDGEPGGSGVDLSKLVFSKDIDVKIETRDGNILTWDEYLQINPTHRQTELSRFLHITAWTTPVHIRPGHEATGRYNQEPDITLNVENTSAYELIIRYPDPSQLPTEGFILHLPQHHWRRSDFLVIGLIDGVFERLAMDNGPDEGIEKNWESMEKTLQTIRLG